eukprot:TRINITY_DN517_c0_g1_i1.p1 TRINITY_DN517_c0_g1~~TRINITY_DN517_c0_g1_i1.p1  ORF type:complete len:412 (-),score=87.53 TRINITY_DN517_c0_g1_i1:212-1447(-)
MIMKGNAKVVEPLWSIKGPYMTQAWKDVWEVRDVMLNQNVITQYHKYGNTQKREGDTQPESYSKRYAHAIRLYTEALQVLNGLEPIVFFEGELHEYIMSIRRKEISYEEAQQKVEELEKQVSLAEKENLKDLPKNVDIDKLATWFIPLKMQALANTPNKEIPELRDNLGTGHDGLKSRAENALLANDIQGTLLFVTSNGASAYGLPTDVDDYIAVFALETERSYQFLKPEVTILGETKGTKTKAFSKGLILVEIEYFARFLFKGNHVFSEAISRLYENREDTWESLAFKHFRESNQVSWLTSTLVYHYIGVMKGSLIKAKKGVDFKKSVYIAQKLLLQVQRVVNGNLPDSDIDISSLLSIKEGHIEENLLVNMESIVTELEGQKPWGLSSGDDLRSALNDFIISVRKSLMS